MKIAVTGLRGQVVTSLLERSLYWADIEIVPLGRPELDLSDAETIVPALAQAEPDIIVSAAAYTAVDRAATEERQAFAVNGAAPGVIAGAATTLSVPLIHLSTDYVFDGGKAGSYAETDATNPLGVYGASKFAGEQAVAAGTEDHVILRTAWVYSPFGHNFLKTMLRLARERHELRVVEDQLGNPTSAMDIADAVLSIARQLMANPNSAALRGIFHMTGAGDASWADFASEILSVSANAGGPVAAVHPIRSSEYPTLAPRPMNSRLCCDKFADAYGLRLPDWRISTADVVARLLSEQRIRIWIAGRRVKGAD
ncbi:MAG: dTDP-4-dehydrorhamnose reductase [Chromatiales bacterium]